MFNFCFGLFNFKIVPLKNKRVHKRGDKEMREWLLIIFGLVIFGAYFYNEKNEDNQIPTPLIGFSIVNFMCGFVMNFL